MKLAERAEELARSGRYDNADAILWKLFKDGYSDPGQRIGWWQRRRLNVLCRKARQVTG